jgi:hypothetical protein
MVLGKCSDAVALWRAHAAVLTAALKVDMHLPVLLP